MTAPPSSFDPIRHRRGGRRHKPEAQRRDYLLRVRLSSDERAQAEAAVAPTGLSLSEFVRAAFTGAVEIVTSETAPPEVLRQLRIMGRNIDQLLHEARRAPSALPALEAAAVAAMQTVNAELRTLIHGPQC